MIRLYTAAYGNSGMNARQVLEEMVCDAMGKMNAFATEETSTVAGEVGQFLRDLRKAALETQTDGQKNNAPEGVKHSREMEGQTQQEITQRYQQEVDSILNMQDTTTRQLIVGYTPTVYQQLGMPSLPLTIGSGHVYSAAKTEAEAKQDGNYKRGTHYHGLGDAALKNIYKAIQDPVMVIAAKDVNKNVSPLRSTHSVVAIVDIGTAKKSLLVPIEITAERKVNGARMDVNTISSVYEKSVKSLVTEAIAQENAGDIGIFYAKKEAMTLPGAGVQFPAQLQQSIASNSIIHRFSEKVNMNISENVQSQQFKRWFGDWQNDPANASKVVNADGTPKVMYHGTNEDFTVFDRSKGKKKIHLNVLGDGNYFTALEQGATRYGSNVVAAYLDIKNPYVKADGFNTVADQIASEFGIARDSFTGKDVSSILRRRGYDGVVMYDGNGEIVIANAFSSNQIKSATDNIGTFDGKNPDIRYSRELDSEYMELAKDPEGNREKISRMVAEAARAAGYDSPLLYHGTQSFGFTQFDLSKMDDGQSIFLTSNPDIASTYSGVGGKRDISNASRTDVSKLSIQEVAKMLNQFPPESGSDYSYSYVSSKADIEKQVDSGIAKLNGMIPALKSKYAEDSSEISKLNHLRNLLFLGDRSSIATALWTISRKFDIFDGNEDFINNLEQNIRLLGKAPSTGGFVVEKFLGGYSIEVLNDAEAREALQKNMQRGNYGLYAKLGNFLTVDGNGNYWNDLKNWAKAMEVDEKNTYVMEDNGRFYLLRTTDDSVVENGFVSATKQTRALSQESLHFLLIQKANTSLRILAERGTTTRDVAKWAKNTGYDSVIFKDIKDSGGQNDNVGLDTTADVYVIFNPNDAKSADAVTYDNNGKVIPLSERFNSDKRDIRYSRELELDSEGNALTQEQTDFFADSEVRNDDGELIPVYHKTTESFTVFQRGKLGKETFGNADDASLAATSLIGHWFSDSENTPFMGNAMKTYLNIKKPYYTSLDELAADMGDFSGDLEMMQDHFDRGQYNMVREAARSYVRWMKWKGYDGLIVNDTETGGTSYVILNSNQAKLTDNGNPTSKRDIRYSRELETVEALKRQNEILQKQRDYWKEQTRTTDEKTRGADKGEVRSLAGQLIRQYSSKTEVEEILPEMQWLADSIWRNDPKISYTDLQDSAQNIARMVLDGSEVNLNAENWETGQELKRFLRGRYINVDEGLKEDIGDFKNFKQSNRSLHFRENGTGTGVASLWLELQNDFGKGLFPDSVSNPGDQIRHIADTLTSLTESDMRNPYAADMELTVEQMAYDVMARAAGLNRQKATKTDNTADSPLLYSVRMLTWAEVSWSMLPSS